MNQFGQVGKLTFFSQVALGLAAYEGALADKGYIGLEDTGVHFRTPIKKPAHGHLTVAQVMCHVLFFLVKTNPISAGATK